MLLSPQGLPLLSLSLWGFEVRKRDPVVSFRPGSGEGQDQEPASLPPRAPPQVPLTPGPPREKGMHPDPEDLPEEGSSRAQGPEKGPSGRGWLPGRAGLHPCVPSAYQARASLPGGTHTFPNQPWPISFRYRRLCRPRSVDLRSCTVTKQGAQGPSAAFAPPSFLTWPLEGLPAWPALGNCPESPAPAGSLGASIRSQGLSRSGAAASQKSHGAAGSIWHLSG